MKEDHSQPQWDEWANYYDLMDGDRQPMIRFYQSLVSDVTVSILELGSGTGLVASALADVGAPGARVAGIDESPAMVERARARDARCEWIVGDMKEPPIRGKFELIVCCYNSLQHMLSEQDLLTLFSNVRQLLAPHGVFAFDLYEPDWGHLSNKQSNRLVRSAVDDSGMRLEIREDTDFDPVSRIYSLDWRLVEEGGREILAELQYRYRQYTSTDIDRLLGNAGLQVLERYGDFKRVPPSASTKKQVVVAGWL
jgi:SAM-dependent methyltransferase